MKTSNSLKEMVGHTAGITLRLFETLANITSEDETSDDSFQLALHEAKQIEDLLYAICGIVKIEKEYPKDRLDEIDQTIPRVVSNLCWTWSAQDREGMESVFREIIDNNNQEDKQCQTKKKR